MKGQQLIYTKRYDTVWSKLYFKKTFPVVSCTYAEENYTRHAIYSTFKINIIYTLIYIYIYI